MPKIRKYYDHSSDYTVLKLASLVVQLAKGLESDEFVVGVSFEHCLSGSTNEKDIARLRLSQYVLQRIFRNVNLPSPPHSSVQPRSFPNLQCI